MLSIISQQLHDFHQFHQLPYVVLIFIMSSKMCVLFIDLHEFSSFLIVFHHFHPSHPIFIICIFSSFSPFSSYLIDVHHCVMILHNFQSFPSCPSFPPCSKDAHEFSPSCHKSCSMVFICFINFHRRPTSSLISIIFQSSYITFIFFLMFPRF